MTGGTGGASSEKESKTPKKDPYPAIEKELPAIVKTLTELKEKKVVSPTIPNQFGGDGFDVFSGGKPMDAGSDTTTGGMPASGMTGGTDDGKALELPEHVLVRLIDVTVVPGKTYEYRMQIRMANPNLKRRDVASPAYADPPELLSEWSAIPIVVRVDPELHFYVVDQKRQETKYRGPNSNIPVDSHRNLMMQAHRWLEEVVIGSDNHIPVGEWSAAERFPVYRGEYVGMSERVELPVWRYTREDFVIAADASTTKRKVGVNVPFGYQKKGPQPEAILVDFTTTKHGYDRVVSRNEDKVETKKVTDDSGQEALVLNPDGRLVLLEGPRNIEDETRKARLDEVRKRVDKYRGKDKATGGGTKFD